MADLIIAWPCLQLVCWNCRGSDFGKSTQRLMYRTPPPHLRNDHQTNLYRKDLVLITAWDKPRAQNVFRCAYFFYCKNNQIAMAPFHEWTFHGAIDLKEVFVPFGDRCPEGNEYEDTNNMMVLCTTNHLLNKWDSWAVFSPFEGNEYKKKSAWFHFFRNVIWKSCIGEIQYWKSTTQQDVKIVVAVSVHSQFTLHDKLPCRFIKRTLIVTKPTV